MKYLKTILREVRDIPAPDDYVHLARAEMHGEISRATYYRACIECGLTVVEACDALEEIYKRNGLHHLFWR